MRKATTRELNTLQNFLGMKTGAQRNRLWNVRGSYFAVKSVLDNGYDHASYISRLTNIVIKTDALATIKSNCLWF